MDELADALERLQVILVGRASGRGCDPNEYEQLRAEVLENPLVADIAPRFLRTNRSSEDFWQYIKYKYPSYHERSQFIRDELSPLFDRVEGASTAPADGIIADTLASFDTESIHAQWTQALARRDSDPEGAITMARSLLESVCKHILGDSGVAFENESELPTLYNELAKLLNLAPSQHTEVIFRTILGNAMAVVGGIAAMRNKLGDSHGPGKDAVRPAARHAGLAVNFAGATAAFLVETYQARKAGFHQSDALSRSENIANLTR